MVQLSSPFFTPSVEYRWRVSLNGTGGWVTLLKPSKYPPAAIGYFVADDPAARLLVWNEGTWWRVTLGEAAIPRHASQAMR